ncbi:MAG: hypothetical protein SFY56_11385 [Bacteroidota bacterium]|nr:hypothetical protein [Bacteroidota bacterium]
MSLLIFLFTGKIDFGNISIKRKMNYYFSRFFIVLSIIVLCILSYFRFNYKKNINEIFESKNFYELNGFIKLYECKDFKSNKIEYFKIDSILFEFKNDQIDKVSHQRKSFLRNRLFARISFIPRKEDYPIILKIDTVGYK